MTLRIHKWHVAVGDITTLRIGDGVVRHIGVQNDHPYIWVAVDAEALASSKPVDRTFEWFGTGEPIPEHAVYVGTIQQSWMVWHLHETTQP